MDFYDETTRQFLALFLSLGSAGTLTVVSLRLRQKAREKRRQLRRDY
jgi:hypothetical protein